MFHGWEGLNVYYNDETYERKWNCDGLWESVIVNKYIYIVFFNFVIGCD